MNAWCETGAQGVYAIGDIPTPWLAHVAALKASWSPSGSPGTDHERRYGAYPTAPTPGKSPASGLTEAAAKEAGYTVKTSKFPFSAIGKAKSWRHCRIRENRRRRRV